MSTTKTKLGTINFDSLFANSVLDLHKTASANSQMRFYSKKGNMTVTYYGKEIQAQRLFNLEDSGDFAFLANATDISDLFQSFKYGVLDVYEEHIVVRSDSTVLKRQVQIDSEFTSFPNFEEEVFYTLSVEVLRLASRLSYATTKTNFSENASTDRISLTFGTGRDNLLSFSAMNKYRAVLAQGESPLDKSEEYLLTPQLVSNLLELCKKENVDAVEIASTDSRNLIRIGSIEVTAAKTNAASTHESILRAITETRGNEAAYITLNTAALKEFLGRTRLLQATETPSPLSFSIVEETEMVTFNYTTSLGNITGELPAKVQNTKFKALSIGCNVKYFLDLCEQIREPELTIELYGQIQPILVREMDGNYELVHMVLPIRAPQGNEEEN